MSSANSTPYSTNFTRMYAGGTTLCILVFGIPFLDNTWTYDTPFRWLCKPYRTYTRVNGHSLLLQRVGITTQRWIPLPPFIFHKPFSPIGMRPGCQDWVLVSIEWEGEFCEKGARILANIGVTPLPNFYLHYYFITFLMLWVSERCYGKPLFISLQNQEMFSKEF